MADLLAALLLTALSVLAAVVPAVAYSLVIWWVDRYEKEPWRLLTVAFVWGAIPAIFVSFIAEGLLSIPISPLLGEAAGQFIAASGVAPVVEELAKACVVFLIFLIYRQEFDGPLDGIVYGALVGFGFGMTENIFYFVGGFLEGGAAGWVAVVLFRTTVFGLNHGLFSSITGLGLGYASATSSARRQWLVPPLALGGAIVAHAVHNTFTGLAGRSCWPLVISALSDWGGVLTIVVIIVLAWDREKRLIVHELRDEIEKGILGQREYETVVSYWRRIGAQWQALSKYGFRQALTLRKLHQLTTELAFQKHRLRRLGSMDEREAEITRLREAIRGLRGRLAR